MFDLHAVFLLQRTPTKPVIASAGCVRTTRDYYRVPTMDKQDLTLLEQERNKRVQANLLRMQEMGLATAAKDFRGPEAPPPRKRPAAAPATAAPERR